MKKFISAFFPCLTALLLTAGVALAQPSGGGGPAPTGPTGPTATPLDGGASLLLAGGISYAVRRLRRRK